jgi:hypothetical protein
MTHATEGAMAKARRILTDKAGAKDIEAAWKLPAEYAEQLKRLARDDCDRWAAAEEDRKATAKAREVIDRAAAIKSGHIAPPWAHELLKPSVGSRKPRSKLRKAPQVERVKQVIPKYWRNGVVPDEISTKAVRKRCENDLDPLPSWDTFHRALGRRD